MLIKSVSDNQTEIIQSIMYLCDIERFDIDLTYANGGFWKNLPQPAIKFDIDPQTTDTIYANSVDLPLPQSCVKSVMFDPPFLTYIKQGRDHNSIMGKRFGGYWKYDELEAHYTGTISEAHRVLNDRGVFVIKCQDIVHNHKMHCTHLNVMKWADQKFRLKDLFILTAKHRMPMPSIDGHKSRMQKHARIHHSYFMVLEKC